MVLSSAVSESFAYHDMRRGMKRKLFFVFAGVALVLLFFLRFTEQGSSLISDELELLRLNYSRLKNVCAEAAEKPDLPLIYAITPTYTRPVQKAELTRLSHTLKLVPSLRWILVEDASKPTPLVEKLLEKSGIPHVILTAPTPKEWKLREKDPNWKKPRGVLQRNRALQWIRENVKPEDKAVIYFADDDNVYSLEVFEEMRSTKGVSVWPVGLVGGLMVERPLLDPKTGRVSGWNAAWRPERPFPIDMAGFAVSTSLLLSRPNAKFSLTSERGFQESHLLKMLTTKEELEPKADGCTQVYVWHTRTEAPKLTAEQARKKKLGKSPDSGIEV